MNKKITIVGMGLIGGSIAKGLRESGFATEIIGVDLDIQQLKIAENLGIIDRSDSNMASAVAEADIIILSVPVLATYNVLGTIVQHLSPRTIITDVGSSKASVVAAAQACLGAAATRFVPGHPIAGREKSGVAAAQADMFQDHRVILTPLETTESFALQQVTELWQSLGAQVTTLGVRQHDLVLGATSHLPHVLAFATVDTLSGTNYVDEIFAFAAGGFRDFTRIASSDPVMWRDICLANRDAILDVLGQFEQHLATIRHSIEVQDKAALTDTFARAKKNRDDFLQHHQDAF